MLDVRCTWVCVTERERGGETGESHDSSSGMRAKQKEKSAGCEGKIWEIAFSFSLCLYLVSLSLLSHTHTNTIA